MIKGTQVGVELLGGRQPADRDEIVALLERLLTRSAIPYVLEQNVKRGLGYYTACFSRRSG